MLPGQIRCPYCYYVDYPVVKKKISSIGILFICLSIFTCGLSLIGLTLNSSWEKTTSCKNCQLVINQSHVKYSSW
ncbi:MAG TPA: hypothetical protein DEP28_06790 [Bacteroidetes bacterium]|nr:hypothetical protein [Bacteroidota bacterium]